MVLTETLLAIGLTVVLAALMASATVYYGSARREADTRRLLRLAAAAELDRMRAGLVRVELSAGLARVEPGAAQPPAGARPDGVTIATAATPGEGAWSGLTLVQITARKEVSSGRSIEVAVAAYLEPQEAP